MSNRDDFTPKTKEILAKRTGYKCSFPSCWINTIGPSDEKESPIDTTGMACHIYAAAEGKGAKRYKKDMTSEERKSLENGIWMCYKHGKQIDNDENRFTAETLHQWKKIAEKRAQIEHEIGKSINGDLSLLSIGLAKNTISIDKRTNGHENELIANALIDSNAQFLWGKDLVEHIKIYLIELVRNAFLYSKAENIQLKIETNKITLIDDGNKYSIQDLLKEDKPRGGVESYKQMMEKYRNDIMVLTEREQDKNNNIISFVNEISEIENISTCIHKVYPAYCQEENTIDIDAYESCSDIYILLHSHPSISDIYQLGSIRTKLERYNKPLVFVLEDTVEYLAERIQHIYPESRIMHVKANKA